MKTTGRFLGKCSRPLISSDQNGLVQKYSEPQKWLKKFNTTSLRSKGVVISRINTAMGNKIADIKTTQTRYKHDNK